MVKNPLASIAQALSPTPDPESEKKWQEHLDAGAKEIWETIGSRLKSKEIVALGVSCDVLKNELEHHAQKLKHVKEVTDFSTKEMWDEFNKKRTFQNARIEKLQRELNGVLKNLSELERRDNELWIFDMDGNPYRDDNMEYEAWEIHQEAEKVQNKRDSLTKRIDKLISESDKLIKDYEDECTEVGINEMLQTKEDRAELKRHIDAYDIVVKEWAKELGTPARKMRDCLNGKSPMPLELMEKIGEKGPEFQAILDDIRRQVTSDYTVIDEVEDLLAQMERDTKNHAIGKAIVGLNTDPEANDNSNKKGTERDTINSEAVENGGVTTEHQFRQPLMMKLEELSTNFQINPKSLEELENSLSSFGQKVPIEITEENMIHDGHRRFQAMKNLGWEECLVKIVTIGKLDCPVCGGHRRVSRTIYGTGKGLAKDDTKATRTIVCDGFPKTAGKDANGNPQLHPHAKKNGRTVEWDKKPCGWKETTVELSAVRAEAVYTNAHKYNAVAAKVGEIDWDTVTEAAKYYLTVPAGGVMDIPRTKVGSDSKLVGLDIEEFKKLTAERSQRVTKYLANAKKSIPTGEWEKFIADRGAATFYTDPSGKEGIHLSDPIGDKKRSQIAADKLADDQKNKENLENAPRTPESQLKKLTKLLQDGALTKEKYDELSQPLLQKLGLML